MRYGEWEQRDDLPPIRKQHHDYERGVVVERLGPVIDRKVYETWIENGERMGRWTWESGISPSSATETQQGGSNE